MKNKDIKTDKLSKRDEIIARAYAVFHQHGLHATGVDTVMADTGISKRTLYKYFRTKEELIEAVVSHYQDVMFKTIPPELAKRSNDPKEQILSLFDMKSEAFTLNDFGGCFAVNAKLEFKGKEQRIEGACGTFYELLEAYVMTLCEAAQCQNPRATAQQLMILFVGGLVVGQVHHDAARITMARDMARLIIERDATPKNKAA